MLPSPAGLRSIPKSSAKYPVYMIVLHVSFLASQPGSDCSSNFEIHSYYWYTCFDPSFSRGFGVHCSTCEDVDAWHLVLCICRFSTRWMVSLANLVSSCKDRAVASARSLCNNSSSRSPSKDAFVSSRRLI
jgi:hypothetical protein